MYKYLTNQKCLKHTNEIKTPRNILHIQTIEHQKQMNVKLIRKHEYETNNSGCVKKVEVDRINAYFLLCN